MLLVLQEPIHDRETMCSWQPSANDSNGLFRRLAIDLLDFQVKQDREERDQSARQDEAVPPEAVLGPDGLGALLQAGERLRRLLRVAREVAAVERVNPEPRLAERVVHGARLESQLIHVEASL